MSKHVISIQVSDAKTYVTWISFIEKNRYKNHKDVEMIEIDFSNDPFLKPFQLTSLSCLIEEYHQKDCKIEFKLNENSKTGKYLKSIRFSEYWKEGFDRSQYTSMEANNSLYLWKIGEEYIDGYTSHVKEYMQNAFFENKDLSGIHKVLSEIFNNIFNHSNSEVDGYVFIQYYPKEELLRVSVCDFGIGIPSSVNNYLTRDFNKKLTDELALRVAFKKHFSVRSIPQNMGYGLDTLHSVVMDTEGGLMFYSNNGLLRWDTERLKFQNVIKRFNGTLIDIKMRAQFFPDEEEDVFGEDFIF